MVDRRAAQSGGQKGRGGHKRFTKESEERLDIFVNGCYNTYRTKEEDELTAKITGLKDILANKNSDVSDKENLRKHLKASVDKCIEAIEYRGHTLEELKGMYETGTISVSDRTKLMGLNNELHEYQKEYDEGSRETEAKEALLNRKASSKSSETEKISGMLQT